MTRLGTRNRWITLFVLAWIGLFHYETLRLNYLSPLAGHELPKTKLLYPPAGWIMFFNVDSSYGMADVYGIKNRQPSLIDPHEIFATKNILYDNIRRNVLVSVLFQAQAPAFCSYLRRKFPHYDEFAVVYAVYPDVITKPTESQRQLVYRCQ